MLAILLHAFLLLDVFIPMSLINATREINVTTIHVMIRLDAHKLLLIAMTMITVQMILATHLLDVYIHHTTAMIITLVLPNHARDNVIMNELTVTMVMLVPMIVVYRRVVANILLTHVMMITLVLLMTAIKNKDVFTLV